MSAPHLCSSHADVCLDVCELSSDIASITVSEQSVCAVLVYDGHLISRFSSDQGLSSRHSEFLVRRITRNGKVSMSRSGGELRRRIGP